MPMNLRLESDEDEEEEEEEEALTLLLRAALPPPLARTAREEGVGNRDADIAGENAIAFASVLLRVKSGLTQLTSLGKKRYAFFTPFF
jgi:hypothetical protein